MINKKYTPTEKNGGNVPIMEDERVKFVQIPCGHCIECRKEKARNWQVRLLEEIKDWNYKYFVTFTFTNEALRGLMRKTNNKECNACAAYALRHCLERYRKDYKKSLRHWMITELGHEGTERIHMHGLLFSNNPLEFIKIDNENNFFKWKYWKYGNIYVGDYVNARTVNYIVKYCNKIDNDHKGFEGQILCSPGIGKTWLETETAKSYNYRPNESKDYYRINTGNKIKLPTYYKNKRYNEDERELIWREKMDLPSEFIAGHKFYNLITPGSVIENVVRNAQIENIKNGYGDDSNEFRKKEWNITRRMLERTKIEEDIIAKSKFERLELIRAKKKERLIRKMEENYKMSKKNLEILK